MSDSGYFARGAAVGVGAGCGSLRAARRPDTVTSALMPPSRVTGKEALRSGIESLMMVPCKVGHGGRGLSGVCSRQQKPSLFR